jgi:hypothetical protein
MIERGLGLSDVDYSRQSAVTIDDVKCRVVYKLTAVNSGSRSSPIASARCIIAGSDRLLALDFAALRREFA